MGTKTIRVREDVYEILEAHKRPEESFSDLLERLTDRSDQFERGFGALADVDLDDGIDELDDRLDVTFSGPDLSLLPSVSVEIVE